MSPQAHFNQEALEKIASLRKGQKINLVCKGGGSIAGTPMFNNCQFASNYAQQKIKQLESDITDYLGGKKIDSKAVKMFAVGTIATERVLLNESMCTTNTNDCLKDVNKTIKSGLAQKNLETIAEELKSLGIDPPILKKDRKKPHIS